MPDDLWKWELKNIDQFPFNTRGVVRQLLEEQPLVRSKRPQRELGRTIAGFDHARIRHIRKSSSLITVDPYDSDELTRKLQSDLELTQEDTQSFQRKSAKKKNLLLYGGSEAKEVINLISKPPAKLAGKQQKVVLMLGPLVLLIGGVGGDIILMRSHSSSPTTSHNALGPTPNSFVMTSTAQANVLFWDPLTKNIHEFQVDKEHLFKNGTYHIFNQTNNGAGMVLQQTFDSPTLVYTLTMEEIIGDDTNSANTFGMMLNYNGKTVRGTVIETFYSFEIANDGANSHYVFDKYDGSQLDPWTQIGDMNAAKEFHGGHGDKAVNIVKVVENRGAFTFFINGIKVGDAVDNSLKPGSVGMLVNLKGTEVAFSNMLITRS